MAKRVYFAFHYDDVINFRANVVRNHNVTSGVEKAGYYDASIWEEAKKKGDLALKRMINSELGNTSVTAVLIGSGTFARRWVKYEIFKSIERGNRVIGIHINAISDKTKTTSSSGPNPFDYLALSIESSGQKATPLEWKNGQWSAYTDADGFVISPRPEAERGKSFKLSNWLRTYDWVADRGYENFSTWVD